eukprot:TRINITY_DN7756_c0_g1_i18.p1 TRINITY_DN7756_c0_g1~~TRINITY_DN7756_c0_g1_i18.p1  ORF type:complete len:336 (-),score=73.65 TRINITY_DN7756_c0_g1_i18:196-1203(-)
MGWTTTTGYGSSAAGRPTWLPLPSKDTCAANASLASGSQVYCWGGEYGGTPFGFDCLGAGLAHQQDWGQKEKPIANATMPRRVKGLNDHFIMQVACGSFHTAAITEFGQLYTWGQGSRGQLGHKNNMDQCEAKLVDSLFSNRSVLVDCGHVHTMCLLNNGDVVSFGGNSSGQLGHGDKEDESTPKLIASLTGEVIRTIACGFQHSAAVNSYTTVYTWGEGTGFRLGQGGEIDATLPTRVPELDVAQIRDIKLGIYHSVALSDTKRVYTWGLNDQRQCGHDDKPAVLKEPRNVDAIEGQDVEQIACGGFHTYALTCRPPEPPDPPSKKWKFDCCIC